MHLHKVTHILGLLLIFLSVFMLLPVPFSLYYGESDAPAFLISAALSLVAGFIAYKTRRRPAAQRRLRPGHLRLADPIFFRQLATPPLPASGGPGAHQR